MPLDELATLTGLEAQRLLREGKITALELTEACLARIAAAEPRVQAWAFLDPELARAQARRCDEIRRAGRPQGPLHGIPVGVKDIIDTRDMPTENGTVLHAGRRPTRDAAVVERLRAAGAIVLGKTVTTELAVYHPGKTRNPHDPERTPGGSSSGSAAAVAAHMVPLAHRFADQRLGDPPGELLRRVRLQAVVRPDLPLRRARPVAPARSHRRIRPHRRGPRADRRAAHRLRCSRPRHAARDAAPPARGRVPGLARAARPRVRQEPGLGPGRGRPPRGLRRAGRGARAAHHRGRAAGGLQGRARPAWADHGASIWRGPSPPSTSAAASSCPRACAGSSRAGGSALAIDYARALDLVPALRAALDPLFARYDMIVTPATTGPAAARAGEHRQPGVLHHLDAARACRR